MRSNRSLVSFDKNSIPKSARVKYVNLRLFYDTPMTWSNSVYSTGPEPINSDVIWYGAVLQRVVEPWEENKVTWNNQPATVVDDQVYIAPFISNVNFIDIDVTRLFINNSDSSVKDDYGMLFKLYPTELFAGFRFASSDYEKEEMRPMLTVYYALPLTDPPGAN